MTREEAVQIIELCNYYAGAEDTIGQKCVRQDYADAKKKYQEAKDVLLDHETDLLKEFVECIRKYLEERKDALGRLIDSNRRVQESLKHHDDKISAEPIIRHEEGEWCGYDKVDYWLCLMPEKFLEEKNK